MKRWQNEADEIEISLPDTYTKYDIEAEIDRLNEPRRPQASHTEYD
jgi:hypothetical protein